MPTILLTGFEPFGGDTRNPSAEIVRRLEGRTVLDRRVVGLELSCVFGRARQELCRALRRYRPELVIGIGLAADRIEITPERVALNVDDARIPDNAAQQPIDRPIVRGGPTAYWSTLPSKGIVAALRQRRIPARLSQTAGTFVCNHVFYALMHELRSRRRVHGGFIHVPWPADWAPARGSAIPFAKMVRAIETAIEISLNRPALGRANRPR